MNSVQGTSQLFHAKNKVAEEEEEAVSHQLLDKKTLPIPTSKEEPGLADINISQAAMSRLRRGLDAPCPLAMVKSCVRGQFLHPTTFRDLSHLLTPSF